VKAGARERAAILFGASAIAGTAFGVMAAASAKRATVPADNRIHDRMRRKMKGPASKAAKASAPVVEKGGKWWIYTPVALGCAVAVLAAPRITRRGRRGRTAGAVAILLVPALATVMSKGFDRWLPQPRVGRRQRPVDHPVFPSGHGFRAAAVALTTGYVVAREGIARPAVALSLAGAAPVIVGLGRLVREKHLASDTVGGWLAGTAVAATLAGTYELTRAPRRGPALMRRFG
jgi:membrane-associated phospholipid phosphatase